MIEKNRVSSILVVKLSALGDILQSMQAVNFIREQFSHSQIDWIVEKPCEGILKAFSSIDQVISCDTKKWRVHTKKSWREIRNFLKQLRKRKYDLLIDLQGNCKSGLINFFAKAKYKTGLGPLSVSEWPNLLTTKYHFEMNKSLPISQSYLELVQKIHGSKRKGPYQGIHLSLTVEEKKKLEEMIDCFSLRNRIFFMVCFGSKWKNKKVQSSMLVHFLQKVRKKTKASFLFIWGNEEEKKEAKWFVEQLGLIDAEVGNLSFPLWQGLMREVKLIFSMDSSSLHLAALANVPTFSFFGPSQGAIFNPEGHHHGFIQGVCPYKEKFVKRCLKLRTCKTGACLKELDVENVFNIFFSWWDLFCHPKL